MVEYQLASKIFWNMLLVLIPRDITIATLDHLSQIIVSWLYENKTTETMVLKVDEDFDDVMYEEETDEV